MTTHCTSGRRKALQGNFYARRSASCAVAFLVMVFSASEAKGIVIDDFEEGSVSLSDTTPDGSAEITNESGLSDVLGGTRDTLVKLITGGESTLFNATLAPNGGDDGISYTISAGATGLGLTSYKFPSTADFEAAGHDRFVVTFLTPTPFPAILTSGVNGIPDFEFSPSVPAGTSTMILPYSSHGTFSPGDFSAVTAYLLRIVVDTEPPGIRTFVISDIRTIPEPSTLTLAALGLIGLLACGRRRRRVGVCFGTIRR